MSTENDIPPKFESEIPLHLIDSLSPKEKWQYEQISIQGKQNEWLIERSIHADKRQNDMEERVNQIDQRLKVFEDLKTMLTAKWSLMASVVVIILIPMALAAFGAWVTKFFEGK